MYYEINVKLQFCEAGWIPYCVNEVSRAYYQRIFHRNSNSSETIYSHFDSNKVITIKCRDMRDNLLRSGPVFCLSLGVSSDYAQPTTVQVAEVTFPVIGRAQPEVTPSWGQKTGPGSQMILFHRQNR